MSGRRVYPRFRQTAAAGGQLRLSRDVAVVVDETSNELLVVTDRPGVIGDELTLSLVNGRDDLELRVRIADSRPHLVNGLLRHRVRLEVLTAAASPEASGAERSE